MNLQRHLIRTIYSFFALTAASAFAFDDFNVQVRKTAHEEIAWRRDIYTTTGAELWKSESKWFQSPAVTLRLNYTREEPAVRFSTPSGGGGFIRPESDLWSPMLSAGFQTWGGIDVGVAYAHSIHSPRLRVVLPSGGVATIDDDNHLNSVGGYVAKQWDCGLNVAGTWSYTSTEGDTVLIREFDTVGASGGLGFARSFGERKIGRNIFVDTSANFLYQSEEETWHFLWLAKVGHNLCPRAAVYGVFNLFHRLEDPSGLTVPLGPSGYHPLKDETWGEAGGGLQAQIWRGLSATVEATVPVLDEEIAAEDAFQIRAALHWKF